MATSSSAPLATVGILSIGDMGVGIAKRLKATGFAVATTCQGRSQDTIDRAKAAEVEVLRSDAALVGACDVILSVVPPRDSEATADRVIDALSVPGTRKADAGPLYFADMNAVAPSTARSVAAAFGRASVDAVFVDGSIIGGPPSLRADGEWYLPSMPLSGPARLLDLPYGEALGKALRMYHISADIGAASGLKMCFASMSKGYTAISIQAWTTAQRLGVLGDLRDVMASMIPARLAQTENGLVGMAPKAYRWVREMEEISKTFAEDGGFSPELFAGVAGVYRTVTEDTVLGQEKIGQRKRGKTADDTAAAIAEGLERKRKKTE